MIRALAPATVLLLACFIVRGQSAGSRMEFEVASIKPTPPPDGRGITVGCSGGPGTSDPGMIACENMSAPMLLSSAYEINYDQIKAPDWMVTPRFDIIARVPRGATKQQLAEMWQHLLIDRFKLVVHRETKIMAKYVLVVADGGPKFKEAVEGSTPRAAASDDPPRRRGPNKLDNQGFPVLERPGMIGMNGRIALYEPRMTMEQLARILSGQSGRPVMDNTGLKGQYAIRLYWASDTTGGALSPQPREAAPAPAAPEPNNGPALMLAVQQQLGLRLEAAKGPIDFPVVDHMEKSPTEN